MNVHGPAEARESRPSGSQIGLKRQRSENDVHSEGGSGTRPRLEGRPPGADVIGELVSQGRGQDGESVSTSALPRTLLDLPSTVQGLILRNLTIRDQTAVRLSAREALPRGVIDELDPLASLAHNEATSREPAKRPYATMLCSWLRCIRDGAFERHPKATALAVAFADPEFFRYAVARCVDNTRFQDDIITASLLHDDPHQALDGLRDLAPSQRWQHRHSIWKTRLRHFEDRLTMFSHLPVQQLQMVHVGPAHAADNLLLAAATPKGTALADRVLPQFARSNCVSLQLLLLARHADHSPSMNIIAENPALPLRKLMATRLEPFSFSMHKLAESVRTSDEVDVMISGLSMQKPTRNPPEPSARWSALTVLLKKTETAAQTRAVLEQACLIGDEHALNAAAVLHRKRELSVDQRKTIHDALCEEAAFKHLRPESVEVVFEGLRSPNQRDQIRLLPSYKARGIPRLLISRLASKAERLYFISTADKATEELSFLATGADYDEAKAILDRAPVAPKALRELAELHVPEIRRRIFDEVGPALHKEQSKEGMRALVLLLSKLVKTSQDPEEQKRFVPYLSMEPSLPKFARERFLHPDVQKLLDAASDRSESNGSQ